jgi:hypothetical protein
VLFIQVDRPLSLFPSVAPFSEQMIVQPAALLQLLLEEALLLFIRIQAVLERLTHGFTVA